MFASRAVALALATALLLTGCSDDEDPPSNGSSSESPAEDGSAVATLVQSGIQQLTAGQENAAQTTFENVLALDSENLYALYNLGLIAQNAGKPDEALDYYDRALGTQSDYVPALYNKAILLETDDLGQSIELYRQVIGIDDQMAAAYMRLGFALVHLGENEEGADFLEQGIAIDPTMEDVEAPSYK